MAKRYSWDELKKIPAEDIDFKEEKEKIDEKFSEIREKIFNDEGLTHETYNDICILVSDINLFLGSRKGLEGLNDISRRVSDILGRYRKISIMEKERREKLKKVIESKKEELEKLAEEERRERFKERPAA